MIRGENADLGVVGCNLLGVVETREMAKGMDVKRN